MILSNIICNRWVGASDEKRDENGKIVEEASWYFKIDRYVCPFVIAAEANLFYSNAWFILILMLGFMIWRYDGWGEMFLAQHGRKDKYESRNRSKFVTIISDYIYANPTTAAGRRKYGILWGGIRGLYDLPTFIALAVLFSAPWIAALVIFMGLQGYIYYLSANVFNKPGTVWPELIVGGLRGILLTLAVTIGFYE